MPTRLTILIFFQNGVVTVAEDVTLNEADIVPTTPALVIDATPVALSTPIGSNTTGRVRRQLVEEFVSNIQHYVLRSVHNWPSKLIKLSCE